MRRAGFGVLCVVIGLCAVMPAAAIGFDPRGAREADGLSREFDDATRLQQLQEAPQLPPVPLVERTQPVPRPPELPSSTSADALVEASKPVSAQQATEALVQAEQQMEQRKRGGVWGVAVRFLLWSLIGGALTWVVWNWMLRRATGEVQTG